MKTWKTILIVLAVVVGLGLIGLFISKPKISLFKLSDKKIVQKIDNEKYNSFKIKVKLTNKFEGSDEMTDTNNIRCDLYCNDNGIEYNKSFIMMFDKETEELINEEDINFGFEILDYNFFSDIYKEVIEKCKNEKLYKLTRLNMNYQTSKVVSK